jgi:PAS domain S-box-containing protein
VPHPPAAAPEQDDEGGRLAAGTTASPRCAIPERVGEILTLLRGTVGAAAAIDPAGRMVEPTAEWSSMFGETGDSVAGAHWAEVVESPASELAEAARSRVLLAPGSRETLALRVSTARDAAGVELTLASLDGVPPGWVIATARALPASVADLDELRARAARYEEMFEEDLTGNYVATADGRLLEFNPAFLEMLGFSTAEEALATNTVELYPDPRERARLLRLLAREGKLKHLELVLKRRDGELVHVVENAIGRFDSDGRLSQIRAYLFDITRQVRLSEDRADALRREREARAQAETAERRTAFLADLGSLLDASLDYRATLNNIARRLVPTLGDYCLIDEATDGGGSRRVAVAHVDPDAELRLSLDVENGPDADPDRHPVVHVLRTGEPVLVSDVSTGALEIIAHDAEHLRSLHEMQIRGYIIVPLTARGRVHGALTLVSSVSGRRFTQQDVELAAAVADRGAFAIDNARLYGRAQQAVRARDEVLAFVSHDLRNPLATILLNASALLDMVPPDRLLPAQREQLEWIAHSSEQMNRLIQDLLDVSRMETGRLPMELAPVDAGNLLWEVGILLQPVAAEKGVELEIETAEGRVSAWLDRERIVRVLWNLVGNAVKFTPAGGRVRVSTRQDGRELRFAVEDTGIGIAPEHQARVFERYWQRGSAGGGTGSGLGLTIARGIVEAHGGRIWFESAVGKGTTFFFAIPLQRPKARTR